MLRMMHALFWKLPHCMRAPFPIVRALPARLCLNMRASYAVMPARRSPFSSADRLCDSAMRVEGEAEVFEYVGDEYPGGTCSQHQQLLIELASGELRST